MAKLPSGFGLNNSNSTKTVYFWVSVKNVKLLLGVHWAPVRAKGEGKGHRIVQVFHKNE